MHSGNFILIILEEKKAQTKHISQQTKDLNKIMQIEKKKLTFNMLHEHSKV